MTDYAPLFQTQIALTELMPAALPTLVGPVDQAGPSAARPTDFGVHLHVEEHVLAFYSLGGGRRCTFLLDPDVESTTQLFADAARSSQIQFAATKRGSRSVVALSGLTETRLRPVLDLIAAHRRQPDELELASFPKRALSTGVLAMHALYPNAPGYSPLHLPPSVHVTAVMGPEHFRLLDQAAGESTTLH
jgi:hypothetical protein